MLIANRYRIDTELGAGAMGTVYKGEDTTTGQTVAIKHLKPELADLDLIERFRREGEALRELNHPNIVAILAAVEEGEDYYLVMEYLPGGDLNVLLQKRRLAISQVLRLAIDIADALTRAHRLNIIHRDLKPANVLLAEDGTPRLTDFGVAHLAEKERVTVVNSIVGTIEYLAPEMLNGGAMDPRIDIWAFGVMLFEMLTGELPFAGKTVSQIVTQILVEPVPDLEELRPGAPVGLVDLIYRMLEKDPHARISSVRHVGAILEDVLQGRTTETDTHAIHTVVQEARFATPTSDIIARPRHNLPAQTTLFVGREAELAELDRLLGNRETRLVTIVSQGGMGKTRLSLEVGERQLSAHEDGVYFVALAPLSDPANILAAVAEATGYQFQADGRDERQQVFDYLRNKRLLLIMDNYEHLLSGTGVVTEILQAAPDVRVLATSRQRLSQSGETVFDLRGMDFPQWETPDDALEYAAVKLFLQGARRAQPQFEVTADNMHYIARICKLVDGLPLGIVLAASWISLLGPEEIASEIAANVDFLESDLGDLPERHRSIHAVFDYSWNLMNADEQQVFMALSVFRGGFDREAAQQVAGASLRTLMALVNKSLIRRGADSGRYDIHELLRQYAERRLEDSGQVDAVMNRCVNYFVEYTEKQAQNIKGRDQLVGLNNIELDFENIQAAGFYALRRDDADSVGRMIEGAYLFCMFRSRLQEGQRLFEAGRQQWPADSGQPARIAGQMLVRFPAQDDVVPIYERGLAIARQHDDKHELAFCLQQLGVYQAHQLFEATGMAMLEESRKLYQELAQPFYEAEVLDQLAWGHSMQGEMAKRFEVIHQCIALRRKIGDRIGTANALRNLATAAWMSEGRSAKSPEYLEEARQLARQMRDRASLVWADVMEGAILLYRGEFETAYALFDEGRQIAFDIHVPVLMSLVTIMDGTRALIEGDFDRALQLVETGLQYDNPERPDPALVSFASLTMMLVYTAQGNHKAVKTYIQRLLDVYGTMLIEYLETGSVSWFAPVRIFELASQGQAEAAVEFYSAIWHSPHHDLLWLERWQPFLDLRQQLREQLGDAGYEAAWERGKDIDLDALLRAFLNDFQT